MISYEISCTGHILIYTCMCVYLSNLCLITGESQEHKKKKKTNNLWEKKKKKEILKIFNDMS